MICSRCATPKRDPEQDHPGVCVCGGFLTDPVCEHGTALDVHCCNCHSGFLFDRDHECPDPELPLTCEKDPAHVES